MKQLEFDFETAEQKAERKKRLEESAENFRVALDDVYIYNKYVDFVLDLIPFRLGWKATNIPSKIRWWAKCKYQKIRYGTSDDDVFSLYYTIAKFTLPKLKYFRSKGKIGVPTSFLPSNYHNLDEKTAELATENGSKEYEKAIDEMIFAFDYMINEEKYLKMPEILTRRINVFDLNREKTEEEKQAWDDYLENCKVLEKRKEHGLKLFAEHFETLWI